MHRSSLGDGRRSFKAEKITKTNKYEGPSAEPLGYGVSNETRILKMKANGQTFTIHTLLEPPVGSRERGIAKELTKGAFGWGSPPKFKRGSRHLCL